MPASRPPAASPAIDPAPSLSPRSAIRLATLALGLLFIPLPTPAQAIPALAPTPADTLQPVRALLAANAWPAAETRLRALIAADPAAPEPHFLLGYTLFRQQRAVDSLAAYTAAAALRAPTADDLTIVASDYILLKDYADADRWLRLATQQAPTNAVAWYLLGRAAYSLDRPDEARQAFLTCLQLDPANLKAIYNLGLTYEHLRQPQQAEAAYRQAIAAGAHSPHPDSQPFLDLGILLLSQEKPQLALEYLRSATTLAPKNPLAHQQLALCLEKLGLYPEAAVEMSRCADLAPQAQGPPFFLGRIYHRLGQEAQAKEQFARAARLAGTRSATDVPNLEP